MAKVRSFAASISYRNSDGKLQEEEFPIQAFDYQAASRMALEYVLRVLRHEDFELRLVGS